MDTMTKEKVEEAARLYEEGFTTAEIATRLKANKNSVLRWLTYYLAIRYKEV